MTSERSLLTMTILKDYMTCKYIGEVIFFNSIKKSLYRESKPDSFDIIENPTSINVLFIGFFLLKDF